MSVVMAEYKRDFGAGADADAVGPIAFQPSSGIQLQSVYVDKADVDADVVGAADRPLRLLLEQLDKSLSPIIESFQMNRLPVSMIIIIMMMILYSPCRHDSIPICSWKTHFPSVVSTRAFPFPVLLLRHAFDPGRADLADGYLADIQTDIMIECCKFGKIKSVFLPAVDELSSSWLNGCAFVTFFNDVDAKECAIYLHNRSFERRRLKACLCLSKVEEEAAFVDVAESKCEQVSIEEDVENFLNSLL